MARFMLRPLKQAYPLNFSVAIGSMALERESPRSVEVDLPRIRR